jgi:hypothetical protein
MRIEAIDEPVKVRADFSSGEITPIMFERRTHDYRVENLPAFGLPCFIRDVLSQACPTRAGILPDAWFVKCGTDAMGYVFFPESSLERSRA